jgi:hypothetical protein
VCMCNQSCSCRHRQKTRDANCMLLLCVVLTLPTRPGEHPRFGVCHSGVGGDSGLVGCYTVSTDVSEERSASFFKVKWSHKNGLL